MGGIRAVQSGRIRYGHPLCCKVSILTSAQTRIWPEIHLQPLFPLALSPMRAPRLYLTSSIFFQRLQHMAKPMVWEGANSLD